MSKVFGWLTRAVKGGDGGAVSMDTSLPKSTAELVREALLCPAVMRNAAAQGNAALHHLTDTAIPHAATARLPPKPEPEDCFLSHPL